MARQKSGLLSQQAQESARYTPDPFPRERVGSWDETRAGGDIDSIYLEIGRNELSRSGDLQQLGFGMIEHEPVGRDPFKDGVDVALQEIALWC